MVELAGVMLEVLIPRLIVTRTLLVSDNQLAVCVREAVTAQDPTPRVVSSPVEEFTEHTVLVVLKIRDPSPGNVTVGLSVFPTPKVVTLLPEP